MGNLGPGAIVSFANPLANVVRDTVVASQVTTGADAETTTAYRRRVSSAVSARPQGGAYSDYRVWGSDVAGVAQVYPYTGAAGQVSVYVESSTETDGLPTAAQLNDVAAAIELDEDGLATRRPVGSLVSTVSIARTSWVATVSDLIVTGSLTDAQSKVRTAVEGYFIAREPFITGLDVLPAKDTISRSAAIGVVEDVVTSLGGTFSTVVIAKASAPSVPVELELLAEGEKVKAASVSFV